MERGQAERIEQLRTLVARRLGPTDWMKIAQEEARKGGGVAAPSPNLHGQDPLLFAKLETSVPERLPIGKGNALFVSGWCYHRERRIIALGIRAGHSAHPILAHSMPRPDVYAARDQASDPHGYAYRSGFWAIVPMEAAAAGEPAEIELVATLSTGDVSTNRLARIELESVAAVDDGVPRPPATDSAEPLIAICMATCNPRLDQLRAQIASLREQTHENWVCVVSDDGSPPDLYAQMRRELEEDPRFFLSQPDERLGIYRNVERALGLVPEQAELVALCNQGDRWHPDKLEALREATGAEVALAYSEMSLVDADGDLLSPPRRLGRHPRQASMTSLMVANEIASASSLFPRRLLDYALPFPAPPGDPSHDHWLALVALARGRIAYVDRPLYDRAAVEHSANALGGRGAGWGGWRLSYFQNACTARLYAEVLLLRCGEELEGERRRGVKRMLKADRSLALAARLALRSVGARLRGSRSIGQERLIVRGILWRHLMRWRALARPGNRGRRA